VKTDPETGEELEEETLETELDATELAIVEELQSRLAILNDGYPFTVETNRGSWTLRFNGYEHGTQQAYLSLRTALPLLRYERKKMRESM